MWLALAALVAAEGVAGAAVVYRIDFERTLSESSGSPGTSAITQSGWTSSAANNNAPTTTTTVPTPAGVTVTAGGAGGYFQGRGGGTWGTVSVTDADWDDVVGDTIAARGGDGTVTISFTGLNTALDYTFTAWHNVSATDSPSFSAGFYTITPTITTGTLVGLATAGAASNIDKNAIGVVAADFSNSVITFTPDGSGNATVLLTSASASQFLTLGGMELVSVPEPSSMVLMLGGTMVALVRRRRS
ncbi:hypothetical protein HAHE_26850 [Haloferula helveola]|uniref:Ice-binding protein C-terminal domain-containing protein n=1 Tax=Haloferula helveola TaxID=490095 RepID=A0ABM7RNG5_9BACT|nr:hypothetical protein HAHE_26850 [Haloferula helveola]